MVTLKTDFAEGDILTAGTTISTSGVNGITTTINHTPPIGSIIAWAKTLTSVPALPTGWLECNGQTISDANSPMNGENVPDINTTQSFLRGASTSGGTGGTDTSTGSNQNILEGSGLIIIGTHTNLPVYYEIVWIIRVS